MDLDRTPSAIAHACADELRALNHRTLNAKAYEDAPEVAEVISALATLTERLPQALQQAEAGLRALDGADQIRLDHGNGSRQELSTAVSTVRTSLEYARNDLARAHEQLRAAAGPLSSMGGPWPDEDGDGGA